MSNRDKSMHGLKWSPWLPKFLIGDQKIANFIYMSVQNGSQLVTIKTILRPSLWKYRSDRSVTDNFNLMSKNSYEMICLKRKDVDNERRPLWLWIMENDIIK